MFGFTVIGTNRDFVDKTASLLYAINGVSLGRQLFAAIGQCNKTFKIVEDVSYKITDNYMAFTETHLDGVYKLEKHIIKKDWPGAVGEVTEAARKCRLGAPKEIDAIKRDLATGIPSVTYCGNINKTKINLRSLPKSYTSRYCSEGHGNAIDTSGSYRRNSLFESMLDVNFSPTDYGEISRLPLRGWYILLRRLKPYLTLGDGVPRPKVIVDEGVNVKYYEAGQSPAVVMAHELIHGYHYSAGIAFKNKALEEAQTVGLCPFTEEKYTENGFRLQLMGTGFRGKISQGLRSNY